MSSGNDWNYSADGGMKFEPATPGLHSAVIAEYNDLGEQPTPKGPKKFARFIFQLDETDDNGTRKEATLRFAQTWGTGDKFPSKIRKTLENWQGAPMSEQQMRDFDPQKLIKVACVVDVEHTRPNEDQRVYAIVTKIYKLKPTDAKLTISEGYIPRAERKQRAATANAVAAGPAIDDSDIPFMMLLPALLPALALCGSMIG
jgi:hypothetical protein